MQKKQMLFKTRGMNQDLSVSAFNPEFSFENKNLRLSTNEGNTTMSWVNEKGTVLLSTFDASTKNNINPTPVTISGTPIGTAVINNQLVLFTTENDDGGDETSNNDCIYTLTLNDAKDKVWVTLLYTGGLNFYTGSPLETLVNYESEIVQKVYWTDGRNQPRVINIASSNIRDSGHGGDTQFDFVPTLQLNEIVTVKKVTGGNGMFPQGVIQYAFTYYNSYGQESNVFHVTPLYYISPKDRGAAPDEKVDNIFDITVTGVDINFDYLRIYSIQRTSINGTPIVKRIQDIEIAGLSNVSQSDTRKVASYTDTGYSGDTVDPTEMLYKGGESIFAETIEQKDGTLFLGNLEISRSQLVKELSPTYYDTSTHQIKSTYITLDTSTRPIYAEQAIGGNFPYYNQLCAYDSSNKTNSVPCSGFKKGNTYRCGVQFQHKSGMWSDPFWVDDKEMDMSFSTQDEHVTIPIIEGTLSKSLADELIGKDYYRVRALIAIPSYQDRTVLCQGVGCPTMYTPNHRLWPVGEINQQGNNDLYAQSSWFFRANYGGDTSMNATTCAVRPTSWGTLKYTQRNISTNTPDGTPGSTIYAYNPQYIHHVEIEGGYNPENKFNVDWQVMTLHSPDIEFDSQFQNMSFSNSECYCVKETRFWGVRSIMEIQTETPAIAGNAGGAVKMNAYDNDGHGFVSGLFYDDGTVEDAGTNPTVIRRLHWGANGEVEPCTNKWLVYPWQSNGSLNNDVVRGNGQGVSSAVLKKKVLSNYRFCDNNTSVTEYEVDREGTPQIFSSDDVTIVKIDSNNNIYQGNIDTALYPDVWDGKYFAFNSDDIMDSGINTPFNSSSWWKTFSLDDNRAASAGLYKWNNNGAQHLNVWTRTNDEGRTIGNQVLELVMKKNPVLMKYKSTPHLIFKRRDSDAFSNNTLPILEFRQPTSSASAFYGGDSFDALRENTWIPCGEPVRLDALNLSNEVVFEYSWGDTYFQRWECLKTYPFTREDPNQIIEIGSFMLETYTNIDGRYDRNRGQQTNVSPVNFNLLNRVYSQMNNFFSYKILPDDFYTNTQFPNQITWSKTKQSGADVDQWTNVTLASTMDMDGDKGKVNKLIRFNDQLLCFQDTGISQVLYNENVQIQSTEGVPIEIANSGKVQGKRYLSGTVGCSNKWSIVESPSGIYFMDSNDKSIYMFNGQLNNISVSNGFNSWCKQNILGDAVWNPENFGTSDNIGAFHAFYDKQNQDVLFVNKNTALAWSERVGAFTSFYDYGNAPWFCNLVDDGIWINKGYAQDDGTAYHLWKHRGGSEYCKFFNGQFDYGMTLICSPEPQLDKTFTNVEFRACVTGESSTENVFTPILPIKHLETWNEHQHGYTALGNKTGHAAMVHGGDDSALKRKFRIWRCDIPRNNCLFDEVKGPTYVDNRQAGVTYPYSLDASLGVSRYYRKPNDRMRNTWLYMKLWKDANVNDNTTSRAEIHDVMVTYFT